MYLYINTSNYQKITLALTDKGGKVLVLKDIKAIYQQAEKLLPAIEKLLLDLSARRGVSPRQVGQMSQPKAGPPLMENVKGIIVVTGPGSFTSLRIGVATANAMAWALQIPVVGVKNDKNLDDKKLLDKGFKVIQNKKRFRQVLPEYGREPNISKQLTINN